MRQPLRWIGSVSRFHVFPLCNYTVKQGIHPYFVKWKSILFFVVWILLITGCAFATMAAGGLGRGKRLLQTFDYRSVSMYAGRFRAEFDEARDFYLKIPLDDMLHGFRKRAGLPAPGVELGGWYTADTGNIFPQIMSAFARMFAATNDSNILEKANAMLTEWAKCIDLEGYFYYSDHPTSRHYFYEKMVGALVDMHLYCERPDALTYLERITDWAEKNLKRDREYANACGDPNDPLCDHSEWYTVSENLYRAYLATGNNRYREFGAIWEYPEFWDQLAFKRNIFEPRTNGLQTNSYHAYSHVNSLSSAAMAYLVSGDQRYIETIRNGYDFLQNSQVFATGGYGPDEELLPADQVLQRLRETHNTFETQCGSWAALKLCKYLMSLTGEARYGDWVERLAFNGLGASLPMTSSGEITYYSDYCLDGGSKELYKGGTWPCCAGSRPMAMADYTDQIYFYDTNSLYVNLYTQARVRWKYYSQWAAVTQRTRFPDVADATFRISLEQPARMALKLRIPWWLAEPMTYKLNGNRIAPTAETDRWAIFDRMWREGDTLNVTLPAKIWKCHMGGDPAKPFAIMYGPIVLAFRSFDGNPKDRIYFNDLEESLVPIRGERLDFRLKKDPNVLVRPFYDFAQGEPCYMYFD